MIGRFMHGLPTRPAFVIAVILVVGSVAGYYFDRYRDCTYHASLREQLYSNLKARLGETVLIADIVPFKWDKLSILTDYQPRHKLPECPFGWDWSKQQRQALIGQGVLNMLVFGRLGDYPEYIDVHKLQINFSDVEDSFTPHTARFIVVPQDSNRKGLLLKPAR